MIKQSKAAAADNDPQANMDAFAKMRAAVDAIREDAHARIVAALTDDQKTKFAAWEKKQKKSSARATMGENAATAGRRRSSGSLTHYALKYMVRFQVRSGPLCFRRVSGVSPRKELQGNRIWDLLDK